MEALSVVRRPALAAAGAQRARTGIAFLLAFGLVAGGVGAGRAITTTYLPVLLDRVHHSPGLIGIVMLVNPLAGFLVPLAVGVWSDRRAAAGLGRRLPYVVGGALAGTGGLTAIAIGAESSYLVLALAGGAVYVGLNATATAHRAIVAESFDDRERPAATSAQEVAMMVGGLAGIAAGGALISTSAPLLFAIGAVALPALALVTTASVLRRLEPRPSPESLATREAGGPGCSALPAVIRQRGAREVLAAQVLWVAAYAALPAFFVLYAEDVLGLGVGTASFLLAAFGLLTGVAMVAAGRTRPERVYPLLLAGAALLGSGLLGAAAFDNPVLVGVPFAAAAIGFGLVTALGFPYFARFIPAGESGSYSGAYFAVRAIASSVALPLAGFLIAATGSYRLLLLQGVAALVALLPLARARPRAEARRAAEPPVHPAPRRLGAVIPCYGGCEALERMISETLRHVDEAVLVDDGSRCEVAQELDALAERYGVRLVRLGDNSGKGTAIAAGAEALLEGNLHPDALLVIDSDGQHPPDRIPAFVEASCDADIVIGDRRADRRSMPWTRRFTNFASSALLGLVVRRRLPDTQCGMRLLRAEALERVGLPPGRYEAETVHLKGALRAGLTVGWVPIPAIYDGASSHFRPLADTLRVLGAILGGRGAARAGIEPARTRLAVPSREFASYWAVRLGALVAATVAAGVLVTLAAPLDRGLFLAINRLGDGPEWLFQALDPHIRNYFLLSLLTLAAASLVRPRRVVGAAAALVVAVFLSDLLLQAVYLLVDRARPSEALAGQALLSHGNNWARIASFPSGHLVVTSAIVAVAASVAPALRAPLWLYVGAVGFTRVLFGAHFPLDVVAGIAFGHAAGGFAIALAETTGLLPRRLSRHDRDRRAEARWAPTSRAAPLSRRYAAARPPRGAPSREATAQDRSASAPPISQPATTSVG